MQDTGKSVTLFQRISFLHIYPNLFLFNGTYLMEFYLFYYFFKISILLNV